MRSKIIPLGMAAIMAGYIFSGCQGTPIVEEGSQASASVGASSSTDAGTFYNFDPPQVGEKIAVITVKDYGEIKIKLFPEQAAKGVENFIGLADMGYYDELIFHRIIPEFMIQGGDPKGNGTGGNCIWGDSFDGGIPEGLYHFSGAVAYANSGSTSTNGSQFYIVNTPEGYVNYGAGYDSDNNYVVFNDFDQMCRLTGKTVPQAVRDKYLEVGGTPCLDGGYTVFGQVFEGLDIVRELGNVETDDNDKPLTQVQMENVKIVEYQG